MSVNTKIGQAATGDDFYPRPELAKRFWQSIKRGNNIVITAPRRVGKTSLMKHFKDYPHDNYMLLYVITESVNNNNEFFRKIFKEVMGLLSRTHKLKTQLSELVQSNKITTLTKDGLHLEHKDCDYFNELIKALRLLQFDDNRLVLQIDEFSQTVENIIEDESEKEAFKFLDKNRELRHSEHLRDKVQFVYAGSIGLENIVSKINATKTINDLYPLTVPPFTREQAIGLIEKLTKEAKWHIGEEAINYIFSKIEWLIPYYLQILIDEIDKIEEIDSKTVTSAVIDEAIDNALMKRIYFEHWLERLRQAYKGSDFKFVKEVLNRTSSADVIGSNEIYDIAVENEIEDSFQDKINALKHDGYLNNNDDPKLYRYNSPLLKIWWNNNVNF